MRDDYFDWLYDLAMDGDEDYRYICAYLHGTEFTYQLPMDSNRFEDGVSLRYRYGYECDLPNYRIASELDHRPCSVFEMMVALALRMEEDIMGKNDSNRTSEWFNDMLESLGLSDMTDDRFDEDEAEHIIEVFLEREYDRNGKGGLFTIDNAPAPNLQNVEIWYQAMWFLNNILEEEEE